MSDIEIITEGLQFPEGPVFMPDGSVILVEIERQTLSRVTPDGKIHVVAKLGGGPNGAALGPDDALYVCNNGGSDWKKRPWPYLDPGAIELLLPAAPRTDGPGPCIQRVSLDGSHIEVLYRQCRGVALRRPNDLVLDAEGRLSFPDRPIMVIGADGRVTGLEPGLEIRIDAADPAVRRTGFFVALALMAAR